MRQLPIESERYCDKCPYESLEIREDAIFADGLNKIIHSSVKCKNADLCSVLYGHLLDYAEENDIEDDDTPDDESDDWSFCSDASYEDRQL